MHCAPDTGENNRNTEPYRRIITCININLDQWEHYTNTEPANPAPLCGFPSEKHDGKLVTSLGSCVMPKRDLVGSRRFKTAAVGMPVANRDNRKYENDNY